MSDSTTAHGIAKRGTGRAYRSGGQAPCPARTDFAERRRNMFRGFKNFLMRGDVIVVAVGLVVALAFSALITAFTTY